MTTLFLVGRIIFAYFWLSNAYSHLFKSAGLIGYSKSKGIPAPKLAVIGSGVLLLVGGLSMLFGVWPFVGIAALVVFLIGTSFAIHNYWKDTDPMAKMNNRIGFYKNMALLGALLMMVMIPMPWAWSL